MNPLSIFIGFDSKEPLAFAVAAHSILRRASRPVHIIPLALSSLRNIYTRERGLTESTEFSLTRFLVPYLSGYRGISVFMDCDVLVQADIYELLVYPLAYPDAAVFACQHDYVPKALTKFDGHEQTKYPRKNWSSVMLFVNERCKALTPEYVNTALGLDLHRFHWLSDPLDHCPCCAAVGRDNPAFTYVGTGNPCWYCLDEHGGLCQSGRKPPPSIGALPIEWNWLVGEYDPNPSAKILHYTNGTPCFPAYANCDHAELWWEEFAHMSAPREAVREAVA